MESVLALARTDGFGVCCSRLSSMLPILNEVFTEPFVLQSTAPHVRGQLGAVPDMPIERRSPAISSELGFSLPLALTAVPSSQWAVVLLSYHAIKMERK